jgi:hypothetical protein
LKGGGAGWQNKRTEQKGREIMGIKIDTPCGYMPQIMKRNVRAAYSYCLDHGISECKVNSMSISFNFADKTGEVRRKDCGRIEKSRFTFTEE